jgi:hypothetical protein
MSMDQQFYVKANAAGQALVLYRMDFGDDTLDELAWGDGKWSATNRLIDALMDGDPDTFPITEEQARELAPSAFASADDVTLVSKAEGERRFTLGPMYVPNRKDAHAEWTDPDELQKAVWAYVKKGDRRIRLQHDMDKVAGEFVEIMTWPFEVEVPMLRKDGSSRPMTFPADTVFLGVQWEPWAWEMVKEGKILGYSIGGKAQRLLVDLPAEPKE